jgi:isocitrate/isopropylmalate dehydrogenase
VEEVIRAGEALTRDLGGHSTTQQAAEAVAAWLDL